MYNWKIERQRESQKRERERDKTQNFSRPDERYCIT